MSDTIGNPHADRVKEERKVKQENPSKPHGKDRVRVGAPELYSERGCREHAARGRSGEEGKWSVSICAREKNLERGGRKLPITLLLKSKEEKKDELRSPGHGITEGECVKGP